MFARCLIIVCVAFDYGTFALDETGTKSNNLEHNYISNDLDLSNDENFHTKISLNIIDSLDNESSPTPALSPFNNKLNKELRSKRGVAQLHNMVACATGCDPVSYKGYGCYCGFLGSGQIMDAIDRCCMYHDICYDRVSCPAFFVYFVPYLWKCRRGVPLCAVANFYGPMGNCAAELCECDKQLAMCLSYSPCPRRRALCTSSPLRFLQNIIMF